MSVLDRRRQDIGLDLPDPALERILSVIDLPSHAGEQFLKPRGLALPGVLEQHANEASQRNELRDDLVLIQDPLSVVGPTTTTGARPAGGVQRFAAGGALPSTAGP